MIYLYSASCQHLRMTSLLLPSPTVILTCLVAAFSTMLSTQILLFVAPALVLAIHNDYRGDRYKREETKRTSSGVILLISSSQRLSSENNSQSISIGCLTSSSTEINSFRSTSYNKSERRLYSQYKQFDLSDAQSSRTKSK